MEQLDREMLHIMSMDPKAYVGYSEFVHLWYFHTDLEIGGNGILSSVGGCHGNTPEDAVHGAFETLKSVKPSQKVPDAVIVKDGHGCKHFRWNGACFAEIPLPFELSHHVD